MSTISECLRDSDCAVGICLCGYCTASCRTDDECGRWQNASCLPSADMGCTREDRLCLPTRASETPGGPTPSPGPSSPDDPGPGILTEPEPSPEPTPPEPTSGPDVSLEQCQTGASAGLGTGSPSLDGYLAEVAAVTMRTRALEQEREQVFAELAETLDLTDSSPAALVAGYEAASAAIGGVALLVWPARCPVAVAELWGAVAACDPELAPSAAPVECKGTCLWPEGSTCEQGVLECRRQSPVACEGHCEGPCAVELAADGTCAEQCQGLCRTQPLDGECAGEVACIADGDGTVPCVGECEGSLTPPEAAAPGCAETSQAAVWLDVECDAAAPVPLVGTGAPDAGAESPLPAELAAFLELFPVVLELHQRATLTLQAAAVLNAALPDVSAAIAELSTEGEAQACAAALLDDAPRALGQAGSDINRVMTATATLIADVP